MRKETFISTSLKGFLNEQFTSNIDAKLKNIQNTLQQELSKYNDSNLDDRWVDIKQALRKINGYFEDGYFRANSDDEENKMTEFLSDLNYSDIHTYKKGMATHKLPGDIQVYKASGDKILFRGVSLKDWNRIKKQGYIDSDMRGAIIDSEGINLAQIPSTARYYLPHNDKGVILAITPSGLDLYMLRDEYIRVFEPIPIDNIVKVSDVIHKNKMGSVLTKNTEQKVSELLNELKNII